LLAALVEWLLERPVVIETCEDNTAAIQAAKDGYSSKLKHVARHNRINIGWLGEFFAEEGNTCRYAESALHKGDLFTKEFNSEKFEACKRLIGLSVPAVVRQQVMSGGIAREVAEHLAMATPKVDLEQLGAGLQAGVNCWVVDTGSGHNLVPKEALTESERRNLSRSADPLKLSTANGIIEAREITTSRINELGHDVCTRVLHRTPRVLSVQQLVEKHGATFSWTPKDGAVLELRGVKHHLPVKQGVPLLALPAFDK
jgi:hypothetical protein